MVKNKDDVKISGSRTLETAGVIGKDWATGGT